MTMYIITMVLADNLDYQGVGNGNDLPIIDIVGAHFPYHAVINAALH